MARSLSILLGQGLSESRALEHPAIGCSDDDTFHSFEVSCSSWNRGRAEADLKGAQSHIPSHHGRNPSSPRTGHPILPGADGLIPAVVRLLVLRWTIDGTLAVLCLPTGDELSGTD